MNAKENEVAPVARRTYRVALREAAAMPIEEGLVEQCLAQDLLFRRAWTSGLDTIDPQERRGRLCVDIGTIAESVATLLLLDAGLAVFAELATAGVHGVDLLALTHSGQVIAFEVKGTLRGGSVPRLGRGRLRQMSLDWLDGTTNPAMIDWNLVGADIYGAIAAVDFARRTWRVAVTANYEHFVPIRGTDELRSLRFAGSQT